MPESRRSLLMHQWSYWMSRSSVQAIFMLLMATFLTTSNILIVHIT